MIIDGSRLRTLMVAAIVSVISLPGAMAASDEVRIVYLTRQSDAYYRTHRAYTGLTLREHHRAIDGIEVGLRESRILTRGIGIAFKLQEVHENIISPMKIGQKPAVQFALDQV